MRRTTAGLTAVLVMAASLGGAVLAPPPAAAGAPTPAPAPAAQPAVLPSAGSITSFGASALLQMNSVVTGPDGNLWYTTSADVVGRVTPAGAVTPHTAPSVQAPKAITTGPDGNLWFVNTGGPDQGTIGRITPAGVISEFDAPGLQGPNDITTGPDGNLWFTMPWFGALGRITPSGVVTIFHAPSLRLPSGIASGPDGALWFTNRGIDPNQPTSSIGRITVDGTVTVFADPTLKAPTSIVAGPDGALWFTDPSAKAIGRITTAGALTWFTTPLIGDMTDLAVGPDGALWFTTVRNGVNFAFAVGRLTTAGVFSDFTDPGFSYSESLTAGPDGAIWVAESSRLARVTTSGAVTTVSDSLVYEPTSITAGADGNLWFTNHDRSIGRVTPTGVFARFTDPVLRDPRHITAGPDGALWFVDAGAVVIGRITTAGVITTFTSPFLDDPRAIAAGPDGALWVLASGPTFWRVTTTGQFTGFPASTLQYPQDLVAGPDGALWFTDTDRIGRRAMDGAITLFTAPSIVHPGAIELGPDGALWFVNSLPSGTGSIGRITTSGTVTDHPDPLMIGPYDLTTGPDGALWYSSYAGNQIGRITTAGQIAHFQDASVSGAVDITEGPDGAVWFVNFYGGSIGRIQASGAPGAPQGVNAAASLATVSVDWDPPVLDGGSPITGYTVTAAPGGATCSWTTGPLTCTVAGLVAGTPYTFTVTATNADGTGVPSVPSTAVTPGPGAGYHPITPVRVLDSRDPATNFDTQPGRVGNGVASTLTIGGRHGVPAGAAAVVMNVTVTNSDSPSFLTVWPAGEPQPNSSNVNFDRFQTIANLATVKLGPGGTVAFENAVGATDVVADVVGYFDAVAGGSRFTGITPTRALDTRDGTGGWAGRLAAAEPQSLALSSAGAGVGIPATATAVVANVTVTNSTSASFLTVAPDAASLDDSSSVNFGGGQTIPNLVTIPLGPDGHIWFATQQGETDVVVDVVGYFDPTSGSLFHPMSPQRMLDDRVGTGLSGPFGPAQSRTLTVGGTNSIATEATAVVANITATNATTNSFASVFPHGTAQTTSTLNFDAHQTIANLSMVKIGSERAIDLYNEQGSVDLVADAVGYFAPF